MAHRQGSSGADQQGEVAQSDSEPESAADVDEDQLLTLLRRQGVQQPETVLADIRQHILSVQRHEHHYRNEVESMAAAAEIMERVAAGEGKRFLQALNRDYETQTWMQAEEQKTQHTLAYLGYIGGLAIAAGLVAGAVYCATIGQPWVAGALVGAAAVSMIPSFLRVGDRDRPG